MDDRSLLGLSRLLKCLALLVIILFTGTTGYMILEKWHFLDALYMTVITITTVGFREVGALSQPGRVFTIFIIFTGIGIIFYIMGLFAQAMIDFKVRAIIGRRKLGLTLRAIKNHYIICGYGRIGKIICRELAANKIPFVVIDNSADETLTLEQEKLAYINGDATSEEVLAEAGIQRARGLVSVVASDADNLFITMSARGLNPELFILARADEEQTEKKLMRAGANRVVMPYLLGGQKMAHTILKPAVTDFLEFTVYNKKDFSLELSEMIVNEGSRLNGLNLVDSGIRQDMDVIIVAIMKKGGEMSFNPSSQTRIEAGDTLISLGKSMDLNNLAKDLEG